MFKMPPGKSAGRNPLAYVPIPGGVKCGRFRSGTVDLERLCTLFRGQSACGPTCLCPELEWRGSPSPESDSLDGLRFRQLDEPDEDSCHTIVSLRRVKSVFIDDDIDHRSVVSGQQEPLVSAPEPFDAFYRREVRRLVGLAYALSGSRLAADDLAQEAMLAAYKKWDEVGRLENPAGWVRRVVSNQAVSTVRRRVSEAKGLSRLAMRQTITDVPEILAESEWIWREVRRLPRRQIQVIALRYYDQLSMSEIADVLDCSKETVNTHLRRARQTLDRRLEDKGDAT